MTFLRGGHWLAGTQLLLWLAVILAAVLIRKLKAQGIPILPHSLIFGHMLIAADFSKENPADINFTQFQSWLFRNFKRYFADLVHLPPVVYFDIWPVLAFPVAFVYNTRSAAQAFQIKNLPKHSLGRNFLDPLTHQRDLSTIHGEEWKFWRSKFNPGFSPRNITALVPELIKEIEVFVEVLRQLAGKDGSWGPVFQLEKKTVNLTFDVIIWAILNKRLHEQTNPTNSPLKRALADQARIMAIGRHAGQVFTWKRMPWHTRAAARNNRIMHDFFMPEVQRILHSQGETSQQDKKTALGLALQPTTYPELDTEKTTSSLSPDTETLESIMSHLKILIFAGYETTAAAVCWMFKLLQDHPDSMAKLRSEHDAIFGPDPDDAAGILTQSPQLLNSLHYTTAVIKETLRLYPLAGSLREGEAGFCMTAPGSSTEYPTDGFIVWQGSAGIQRDPALWPRADEFVPERWLVMDTEDPLYPVKEAWRPFSWAPRVCIGMELAISDIKLVASLVARRFDIEEAWDEWDAQRGPNCSKDTVDGQRLYAVGEGTVHPKDKMPVHGRLR
ncbi:vera protein [Pseudomassariella vexata]|uniref:Vera protein n=1 Tax=Pseudomassariella vexata TaxID=1141098 RepID=A0A1Y2DNJ5_9PEZI|nr:vera protein [Pseudomassariella vexata]ORY60820.1 vera protein [Pseudomassariella vexata]